MFKFLKRVTQPNKLLCSIGHRLPPINSFSVNDFISDKKLPEWWKTLRPNNTFNIMKDSMNHVPSEITVRTCPSFVEVFKNSYCLLAPCDFMIKINTGLNEHNILNPLSYKSSIENAMWIDRPHDFKEQLNGALEEFVNIKIGFDLKVKPSKSSLKLVFMESTYYNNLPFRILPAAIELIPNFAMGMNINYILPKSFLYKNQGKEFLINHGDVLAMLYSPNGKAKIQPTNEFQYVREHERPKFIGNYLYLLSKNKK